SAGGLCLGQHFGVHLGLEGAQDVCLAGELAPEIGEIEACLPGDVGKRNLAPIPLGRELQRGPYRLVAFREIFEHGRTPWGSSLPKKISSLGGHQKTGPGSTWKQSRLGAVKLQ